MTLLLSLFLPSRLVLFSHFRFQFQPLPLPEANGRACTRTVSMQEHPFLQDYPFFVYLAGTAGACLPKT